MNLVAVYGSLRKGFGNNRLLSDAEYVGTTTVEGWELYSLGAFPGAIQGEGAPLTVELYRVGSMARLDMLEGTVNPDGADPRNLYNRVTVDTEYGEAYMYEFNHEVRGEPIESGDWKEYKLAS